VRARLTRPLGAVGAALLLIGSATPGPGPAPVARSSVAPIVAVSERAAPVARHSTREPREGALADLAQGIDLTSSTAALTKAGQAAALLQAIAPTPTPVPTPRPTPRPVAAVSVVSAAALSDPDAERRMLLLINASRAQGGLVALVMEDALVRAARAHSEVETRYGYVYHDGPDGTAKSRYVPACGNGWYGENTGKIWNNNIAALHIEFMNEPWEPINHRTNIMDPSFTRVGIGAVQGRDALYMTMVFCR